MAVIMYVIIQGIMDARWTRTAPPNLQPHPLPTPFMMELDIIISHVWIRNLLYRYGYLFKIANLIFDTVPLIIKQLPIIENVFQEKINYRTPLNVFQTEGGNDFMVLVSW